jgi:capsular polysaccharide biosynthesis protein
MLYVFDQSFRLIENCSHPPLGVIASQINRVPQRVDIHHVDGLAMLIADHAAGTTYSHWILEWLPRLAFAEDAELPPKRVVAKQINRQFQLDSLHSLGYDPMQSVSIESDQVLFFEELLVSSNSFSNLSFRHGQQQGHPRVAAWWQQRLDISSSRQNTRLFLPRYGSRPLLNAKEIAQALKRYSFEEVDPGEIPFHEQVKMFSEAGAVIGSHGAALANLIFAPRAADVLEIFSVGGGTETYAIIAASRGHRYTSYGEPELGENTNRSSNYLGATLPIAFLEGWLRTV